jgi:hypothetical protein
MDQGATLLSVAFLESTNRNFIPHHARVRTHCRDRSEEVRQALLFDWEPNGRAAELATDAFRTLSELTQTSWELQRLCETDRSRAFTELARHLELATQQFELNGQLVAEVEGIAASTAATSNRLDDIRSDLLQRAGGALSLTEASGRIGISRQGLHKRAKTGSAIKLFDNAGGWSALQFLIEHDPNLGTTPRLALIDGRVEEVVEAAGADLGLEGDE